jgi:hypothetical protein
MQEGLWTATFRASTGDHGTGAAVLRGGKVQGGDAQYFYVGTYRVPPGPHVGADLEVELTITRYNQASGTTSVFGSLQQFVLQLKGKTAPS